MISIKFLQSSAILLTVPLLGICNYVSAADSKYCANLSPTESATRTRFKTPQIQSPEECVHEIQTAICDADRQLNWSGKYKYNSCSVLTSDDIAYSSLSDNEISNSMPLFDINDFVYTGGFRLPIEKLAQSNMTRSDGVMAYHADNHSLFMVGNSKHQQLAEFAIPEIINSVNLSDFRTALPIQNFADVFDPNRIDVDFGFGLRINGISVLDEKIIINFMDKRMKGNNQEGTTVVLNNLNDLVDGEVTGPYKLSNPLHSSGWLSEIPEEWQSSLEGSYISGAPSRNSFRRKTHGPTAFSFYPENTLYQNNIDNVIETNQLLDFSFENFLHENELFNEDDKINDIMFNNSGLNGLWTVKSEAVYGFIIPGTSTYLTIGQSSGHNSGFGRGIVQDTGTKCSGICTHQKEDRSGFYWLWDVNDLVKVKNGLKDASDVRPYRHGKFKTPFGHNIKGATFDKQAGILYLSIGRADSRLRPVVLAYQLKENLQDVRLDKSCGEIENGETTTRTRYLNSIEQFGEVCSSELQVQQCKNGDITPWTGTYVEPTCRVLKDTSTVLDLPRAQINMFNFEGGFRIANKRFGEENWAKATYSNGKIAYNKENHSIFLVGHPAHEAIGEFAIPELVNSNNMGDFNVIDESIQDFTLLHNSGRVDTGIEARFRITGLAKIDGKLLVNYINWYDGAGQETDTTAYYEDADDLSGTNINGPFQLEGKAHGAGWISAVPEEWQSFLGGNYIGGAQAKAAIRSRLSNGPSAFVFNPQESIFTKTPGAIDTNALLDFPLRDLLYNKDIYGETPVVMDVLANSDGRNDLWTSKSGAGVGFIIPGTSSYVTIGKSAGHDSGIGYKITQDGGKKCGGYCPRDPNDHYSYYWIWDVNDLAKVQNGEMLPHEIRPYSYGKFPVPVDVGLSTIQGGSYDPESGKLYLSVFKGDVLNHRFAQMPLFLVYSFDESQLIH